MQDINNTQIKKEEREQVIEFGSDVTQNGKYNIYTLTIIGQVEGHQVLPENAKTTKYEHVLPLLAGIEESDEIDGLLLLLNTVGSAEYESYVRLSGGLWPEAQAFGFLKMEMKWNYSKYISYGILNP